MGSSIVVVVLASTQMCWRQIVTQRWGHQRSTTTNGDRGWGDVAMADRADDVDVQGRGKKSGLAVRKGFDHGIGSSISRCVLEQVPHGWVWCAVRVGSESKTKCGHVCVRRCNPGAKSLLVLHDTVNDTDNDAWGEKRWSGSPHLGTAQCEQH
jgi:hypothetical protein